MAKLTVLSMTQNILSALNSDEVNSISDTVESMQVAKILENKYYDIVSRGDLPDQETLIQLDGSNDATKPVLMYSPASVSSIEWLKYFDSNPNDSQQQDQFGAYSHGVNTDLESSTDWTTTSSSSVLIGTGTKTFVVASSLLPITVGQGVLMQAGTSSMFGTVASYASTTLVVTVTSTVGSGTFISWVLTNSSSAAVAGYKYVTCLPIDQFLDMVNRLNPVETNVGSFTFTEGGKNYIFYFYNDKQPRYWTMLENRYIIFDSYDSGYDTTLQSSKTLGFGSTVTPFELTDTFIPDLDDNEFPLLLNEAKALAFFELKQIPHPKAEQEIRRQWSLMQKNKAISNKPSAFDQLANFGRVPRSGGYSSGGYGAYKWMRQTGP